MKRCEKRHVSSGCKRKGSRFWVCSIVRVDLIRRVWRQIATEFSFVWFFPIQSPAEAN